MKAQGTWDDVVVVVASEFGRTLASNGQGTDHGWGGVAYVLGGAVRGGVVHGRFPDDLTDAGPLTLSNGRLIPTTPWEGLWLGVASWFGVHDDDLDAVLPNLANFPDDAQRITEAELFK
jgi:cullin-associated NEDD8-dissociated protein 1